MRSQFLGVTENDLLTRSLVDAEGLHGSRVVDHDMAVFPEDLGKVLVSDFSRTPSQVRHAVGPDVVAPFDQVSGHTRQPTANGSRAQTEAALPEEASTKRFAKRSWFRWAAAPRDLTVDPADNCTFWYTQEYLGHDVFVIGTWRTRIVSFNFPGCKK